MRVLQCTKRSVTLLAAACLALAGCGGSDPEVPFNSAGTSEDIESINATFSSPVFGSFSTFSQHFDAALGPAPNISASAQAFNFRGSTTRGELRAAAVRNALRVAALTRSAPNESFSASSAAIPAELAGKTFEYSGGSYVPTTLPGAPANGVRFLIYAVNPITFEPVEPLQQVGYVQLTDLSGSNAQAARVMVVSEETTYLDYTVTATATSTGGRVTVLGYVTDGTNQANINLRSTISQSAGLTLLYTLGVPQRDLSINLTMNMTGFEQQNVVINIGLGVTGPNGSVAMDGQISQSGASLTVRVNGGVFATISSSGAGEPVITGANGQPLSDQDAEALGNIFDITGEAFTSFDAMLVPVGAFLTPEN